jgi:hypothetical protein
VIQLDMNQVESISQVKSFVEQFDEKLSLIKPGDIQSLIRLSDWCEKRSLLAQSESLREKAIALNPNHLGARVRLGYQLFQGKWTKRNLQFSALTKPAVQNEPMPVIEETIEETIESTQVEIAVGRPIEFDYSVPAFFKNSMRPYFYYGVPVPYLRGLSEYVSCPESSFFVLEGCSPGANAEFPLNVNATPWSVDVPQPKNNQGLKINPLKAKGKAIPKISKPFPIKKNPTQFKKNSAAEKSDSRLSDAGVSLKRSRKTP